MNPASNEIVAEMIREKIRSIVNDPETAEALCPKDHYFGTKRPCLDTGYFETYNLPHVRLVDLRKQPIASITENGIDTADESFDVRRHRVRHRLRRHDRRPGGRRRHRPGRPVPEGEVGGRAVHLPRSHDRRLPELLHASPGPGSPSVLSNMAVSIEQHVDWVADCLEDMREEGFETIEPTPLAEAGWNQHVQDCAAITLHPTANSWYMGANVPGKPRVFLPYIGGVDAYRQACDEVVAQGLPRVPADRSRRGPVPRRGDPPDAARCRHGPGDDGRDGPAAHGDPVGRRRAGLAWRPPRQARPPGPEVGEVTDGVLPGPAGDLPYRLYRPAAPPGPHPVVVYFHGGGWVLGDLDSDDPLCRDLCARSGAVIVSVNYRHAPEDRFPAAARRRLRGRAVGGRQRHRAGRHPRPARRRRLERRRQHRRRRLPAGPRRRRPAHLRAAADTPGRGLGHDPAVLQRERRRLHPHHRADALVLGPLRRPGRPRRPPRRPAARQPGRPAPGRASSPRTSTRCATRASPTRDALEAAGVPVRHIRARGHTHTSVTMVDVVISGAPVRAEIAEALRDFFPAP